LDETEALSQNLTSVRLQDSGSCSCTGDVARRNWSGILRRLSGFAGVKHFAVERLHRSSDWDLFHLPHTTEKYEISGENATDQLKALASLVATEFVREGPQPEGSIIEEDDVIDLEV
jgi:hypothetical protein